MSRQLVLTWALVVVATSATRAQISITRELVPAQGIVFDNKPLTPLARVGLYRQWYAAVPVAGTERLIEISLADRLLFAQTDMGNLYTFDAETGQLYWSAGLGRFSRDAQPASANSKMVFVTHSNFLYALDRGTGRIVWTENLTETPTSATACDEYTVMVGLNSGRLVGLRTSDKFPVWNWQVAGPLTSRPEPAGQMVAFGDHAGKFHVALEKPPTMLYRIATGGEIFAPLGAYGTHLVLVPSTDRNVYAVDLFKAEIVWTFASGAPVRQQPLVADKEAYVTNTAGVVTALNVETGVPRWSKATFGGQLLSVSGTRVHLRSHDGDLFIVDRATGASIADPQGTLQRAGLNLRDYTLAMTNDVNDRLYFATPSGLILCLREIGQNQPRPLRDPRMPKLGTLPSESATITPPAVPAPAP